MRDSFRPAAGAPVPPFAAGRCGALCAVGALILGPAASWGGESAEKGDLLARSLPLRAALHHDPAMAAPLTRLLELYRKADAVDRLVGIYRAHVTRYPADAKAACVLVRLLLAAGDREAGAAALAAVGRHPDDAYLRYLLYRTRHEDHEPGALDDLDRAIDMERLRGRRREWIEELLSAAVAEDRYDLAEKHLRGLGRAAPGSAEAQLDVGRKMISLGFHSMALETLEAAANASPAPETGVDIQMAAASAEVGLNRMDRAAARLDRLLSKVTADYSRRPEILRRRTALVGNGSEREAMIGAARGRFEASPRDEAAALDLAQVLCSFERRRDALGVLLEGGRRLPPSGRIERETLALFDRLRDERGREAYLAERIRSQPGRGDLVFSRARSLFLLGRSEEALSELDRLVGGLEPAEQFDHWLQMARHLRRSCMAPEAQKLFRRAVELAPSRLDVRRELAETYLATGERENARELFAAAEVLGEAETEGLLDAVQFMIDQEMLVEARAGLKARLARDETNLELHLAVLDVHGRLGGRAEGEKLVAAARLLADTEARYRLWLESVIAFHDVLGSVDAFLETEQARIEMEAGVGAGARLERMLAWADASARSGRRVEAAVMIQMALDEEPSPQARCGLRRRMVGILAEDKAQAIAVEQQLRRLLLDDPRRADEYRAHLALLQFEHGREDLSRPLLKEIDIAAVRDPALLRRLETLYRSQGRGKEVLGILGRLTALDPADRGNWQRWLTALAAAGDEDRLRKALRRLLAGVERVPISDGTRALLRSHLADSCWRSAARLLARGSSAALADALALLDSVGGAVRHPSPRGPWVPRGAHGGVLNSSNGAAAETRDEWLWVTCTRAYILNRLGRYEARDEAIGELDRVLAGSGAARVTRGRAAGAATAGVAFPDGLTLSPSSARRLLTAANGGEPVPFSGIRTGPMPGFAVRWVFDAPSPVTGILPLDARRTLVSGLGGWMCCLDAETGKLLWEKESAFPAGAEAAARGRTHGAQQPVPPGPVTDGEGRIFCSWPGKVWCLSASDGALLWRADVAGARRPAAPGREAFASVFVRDGRAFAFDPASSVVTALDAATGKLVWEKAIPSRSNAAVGPSNAGASLSGRRLLVYAASAAILDVETGEIEWSFEPARVREFPVRLTGPRRRGRNGSSGGAVDAALRWVARQQHPAAKYILAHPPRSFRRAAGRGRARRVQYINYLGSGNGAQTPQRRAVAMAAPAAVWATQTDGEQSRRGELFGGRLLLFGQSKLHALRLGLPVAGKEISVSGAFVGMAGRAACILQEGRLALVDCETGKVRTHALKRLTGGQTNARVRAAVDGPLVYLTGPAGILCVNATSNQRAFMVPWPEAAAPERESYAPRATQYRWRGVSVSYGGQYGPCMPMVDRVREGVLYATVTPTRVVALVGETPGREGRPQ